MFFTSSNKEQEFQIKLAEETNHWSKTCKYYLQTRTLPLFVNINSARKMPLTFIWPKVPVAFATGTDATHQYQLQKQLVPLASGDQR